MHGGSLSQGSRRKPARDGADRSNLAVRILDTLFGSHLDNLERSMSRTSTRHSVLASNLANINTPGYKRRDMDFNIALDSAMGKGRGSFRMQQSESGIYTDPGERRYDGNGVDLEREVVAISETELRYQLLTEMTSRYFSGLKNVIREGK